MRLLSIAVFIGFACEIFAFIFAGGILALGHSNLASGVLILGFALAIITGEGIKKLAIQDYISKNERRE